MSGFFLGFGLVHTFWLCRYDDQSSSDNMEMNHEPMVGDQNIDAQVEKKTSVKRNLLEPTL